MANNDRENQNQQTLADLVKENHELSSIVDKYHDMARANKTIGESVGRILKDTRGLNSAIGKAVEIQAQLGKGLISVRETQRTIGKLAADRLSIEQKLKDFVKSSSEQYAQVTERINHNNSALEESRKKQEELAEIVAKGGLSEQDRSRHLTEQIAVAKEIIGLEKERIALTGDRVYIEGQLLEKSLKKAKAAEDVTKDLLQNVKKSNLQFDVASRSASFVQKALGKIGVSQQTSSSLFKFGLSGVGVLAGIEAVVAVTKKFVEMLFKANQQVTDIQRGFNLTAKDADNLRQYFFVASNIATGIQVSMEDIMKAQESIRDATGATVIYSLKNLKTLADLQNTLGISEEAIKGIATYSNLSGDSFENIRNTVLGTSKILQLNKGITLDDKKILETVLKTTGDIRANFHGNLEELTKAVTQAKLFGTTLEQMDKTSSSLLDFESSISNQFEAQLLTGKNINLEKARSAALSNDMNTVMSEVVKQAGSIDEFNKMNRIAQEGLAKAFGMTRGEISDMLTDYKSLTALRKLDNFDNTKSIRENYERLKEQGAITTEITKQMGEQVAQNLEAQSAGERFQKILVKLEDIISRLFSGEGLNNLIARLGGFVENVGEHGFLGSLFHSSDPYTEKIKQQLNVNDAMITPAGRVSIMTPEGMISPNRKDSIITTTNPGSLLGGGSTEALENKLDIMIDLLRKGGKVEMDSRHVGTTQGLSYSVYA